ncbi:hypothetical protein [Actinoplanes sp. NBRC 101535]|uniref:hypothetical protein n=1 Tax=Actinoplanes sp. NBRC 101535 TaxID=3032196 RepID=UPI0024A5A414|nr:hypothetical protein [Actinoplanes sp. NBRC 101535]GLY04748.1 hypothetical protein Acsp01_51270 [Actinoplanes sp. NBRC 101535]
MRRLVCSIIVGLGLVMVGSSSASADDPTPAPTVSAKSTPGKKICEIDDKDLDEVSGLLVTKTGFVAINDSADVDAKKKVFFLDKDCKVEKEVDYSGSGPRDTEDMILSPDGETIWIADIGDNNARNGGETRSTVGLWKMAADGKAEPKLFRMTYPDGDKHDAEALLLDGDGLPLVVTKEIGAAAGVYKPTAALKAGESGVPMKRVAEIKLSATETEGNALARIGNKTITGGAVAPGGAKVVLRTYTDALEWDVADGNVVAALTKVPRTTGLPNEPFGEAIAYGTDGKTFYTVSDMNGKTDEVKNYIRQYTPATTVAEKSKKSADDAANASWYSDLTLDDITYMVGGVGALGLILVGIGVFGIMRFRKSPQSRVAAEADAAPSGGINTVDPETELIGVGGVPQRHMAANAAGGGGGPVYGAKSGPPAGAGAGAPPRGNAAYSGGGAPQQQPRGPQGPRGPQPQQGRPQQGGGPKGPQQGRPAQPAQQQPGRPQQPGPARGGQQQPPPPRGPQPGRGPQPQQGRPQQGGRPPQGGAPQGGRPQQQPGRGPGPQQGQQPGVYGGGPGPQQGGGRPPQGQQGGRGPGPQGQRPPQGGGGRPPQGRPPQNGR